METAPPPASPILRYAELGLIPVSAAAVLTFALVGLGRSSWIDEAFSALLASRGAGGVIDGLRQDGNFPVYFLMLAAWSRVAGLTEAALRIPSVVFYVAGIAATGALGAAAFGDRRTGAWSAFFFLVSDLAVRHAQNARPYTLLALIVAVSHLLYLRAFFRPGATWRWRAAFVAVTALGALTHVWFLFVVAAQAVLLLPGTSRRRLLEGGLAIAAALVPFCVLWLPAFVGQIRNRNASWIPSLRWTLGSLPTDFYHPVVTLVIAFVTAALFVTARRRAWELVRRAPGATLLMLSILPLVPPLAISLVHPIYVPDRYVIVALPTVAALLGVVATRLTGELVRVAVAAVALAFTLHDHVSRREHVLHLTEVTPGHTDRRTAAFLLEHARPGDVLCFTSLSRLTIDYYLARNNASARFVERTFPAEIDRHPCYRVVERERVDFPELEEERARLVDELERLARTRGARIWLFYGSDPNVVWRLKRDLDERLQSGDAIPISGSCYSHIRPYSAR